MYIDATQADMKKLLDSEEVEVHHRGCGVVRFISGGWWFPDVFRCGQCYKEWNTADVTAMTPVQLAALFTCRAEEIYKLTLNIGTTHNRESTYYSLRPATMAEAASYHNNSPNLNKLK